MAASDSPDLEGRVLDLAHFIGAPLVAVVEADAMAAETFRQFLERVAFEPADTPDTDADRAAEDWREAEVKRLMGASGRRLGRLRYVSFTYDHMENSRRVTSVVKVPLLSLLPLPALQVKEATFDWTLDIVSARRSEAAAPALRADGPAAATAALAGAPAGGGLAAWRDQPRLLAAIAPGGAAAGRGGGVGRRSAAESRVEGHMRVQVTMQSADLPAGLATLLTVMDRGTAGVTVPEPAPDPDPPSSGDGGDAGTPGPEPGPA